jgi:diaminopimelate epimerase
MDVRFVKTDPTGNTTILVESPVKLEEQAEVARRLMRPDCLSAEQVGFVGPARDPAAAKASLRMMGGEFCANAAMSLAAFLVWRDGESARDGEFAVPLEISGANGVTECLVRRAAEKFTGTVPMSPPKSISRISLPIAGKERLFVSVALPGITHIIVPIEIFISGYQAREYAEIAAREWRRLIDDAAFGVLLYDRENKRGVQDSITPLVHVKASDTTVWEQACGSGSAAIGAYAASLSGKNAVTPVRQPGGVITADARYENGAVTKISITGGVRIVARGTAYINFDLA